MTENKGENKLQFVVKNPEDGSQVELNSLKSSVTINENLLEIFTENVVHQFYLN